MRTFNRRQWLQTTVLGGAAGLAAATLPKINIARGAEPQNTLAATMAKAATAFLAGLDDAQRTKATYAFANSERTRWHWTTPGGFPRNGLVLSGMSDDQKKLALALLQSSTSEYGYKKALDIMALQADLGSDPEGYYFTVFGTPGTDQEWGWRVEGHHLSRNFTIVSEQVAITPFFLGAWPTETDRGSRAMPREQDAARELINSLQGNDRTTAIFQRNTLTNHVTQNRPVVTPLDPVGIAYSALTSDQQKLIVEVIQTYLRVLPTTLADANWKRVQDGGLDAIRFGWAGALEPRRPHYYRLQGSTFLLEFDNSRNGGTHIHSVWRDFERDYGYHLI